MSVHITKRYKDIILHGTLEECEFAVDTFKREVEVEVLDRLHSDTSGQWVYIIKTVLKD